MLWYLAMRAIGPDTELTPTLWFTLAQKYGLPVLATALGAILAAFVTIEQQISSTNTILQQRNKWFEQILTNQNEIKKSLNDHDVQATKAIDQLSAADEAIQKQIDQIYDMVKGENNGGRTR